MNNPLLHKTARDYPSGDYPSGVRQIDWSQSVDVLREQLRTLIEDGGVWLNTPFPVVSEQRTEHPFESHVIPVWEQSKPQEVDAKLLSTTQDKVQAFSVLHFLENPQELNTPKTKVWWDEFPVIVISKGQMVIREGNHRAVAALILGHKLKATLVPIESMDKTASPDFGYAEYNNRDKNISRLRIQNTDLGRYLLETEAIDPRLKADDRLQGYVCAEGAEDEETRALWYSINRSFIEPEWKGTGLGQMLYDRVIEQAKGRGATYIYSDIQRSSEAESAWRRLSTRYPVEYDRVTERYRIPLNVDKAKSKAASPDFGYSQYNDKEDQLAEVEFSQTGSLITASYRGSDIGWLDCFRRASTVCVTEIVIGSRWRGTGLGQMLYDKAIAYAKESGARYFSSDNELSDDALAGWGRLGKRYPVEEVPNPEYRKGFNGFHPNVRPMMYRIDLNKVSINRPVREPEPALPERRRASKAATYYSTATDPVILERDEKFDELASAQRGLPESAMLRVQHHPLGPGVASFVLEHCGDLTHRMSEHFSSLRGQYNTVKDKVEKCLRYLQQDYGFEQEMNTNIKNNYKGSSRLKGRSFEEANNEFFSLWDVYADAHAALKVFNYPQRIARDAAVALGKRNFNAAIHNLTLLKAILAKGVDAYIEAAGEFRPSKKLASALPTKQEILNALKTHPLVKLNVKPSQVFVIGSFASDKQQDHSDLDVLLEVPGDAEMLQQSYRRKIQKYFMDHNLTGVHDEVHPQWNGRRIDVYFTNNADAETRPKVKLATHKTPALSTTTFLNFENERGEINSGEGTNGYADLPQKVDGTMIDPDISTLLGGKPEGPPQHRPPSLKAAAESSKSYGIVMVDMPQAIADTFDIDEEDLAGDGLEKEPHITVRFGIQQEDDLSAITDLIKSTRPFTLTLGKTDSFPPSKSSDGASVVIVNVDSPELCKLNEALGKVGKWNEATFEYHPHLTLAYVREGTESKYVGLDTLEGKEYKVTSLVISDANKDRHVVALEGAASKTASPDFGYSKFNDRDQDLGQIRWETEEWPYNTTGISAKYPASTPPRDRDSVGDIKFAPMPAINPNWVYVVGADVNDDWKGTGLGQLLYDKAIAESKTRGYERFYGGAQSEEAKSAWWKRLSRRYRVRRDNDHHGTPYIVLNEPMKTGAAGDRNLYVPHENPEAPSLHREPVFEGDSYTDDAEQPPTGKVLWRVP